MMANTCAEGSFSRAGDGQVFAGMPACNRGKDHAPQFISEQATGNLPRVGYHTQSGESSAESAPTAVSGDLTGMHELSLS